MYPLLGQNRPECNRRTRLFTQKFKFMYFYPRVISNLLQCFWFVNESVFFVFMNESSLFLLGVFQWNQHIPKTSQMRFSLDCPCRGSRLENANGHSDGATWGPIQGLHECMVCKVISENIWEEFVVRKALSRYTSHLSSPMCFRLKAEYTVSWRRRTSLAPKRRWSWRRTSK